MEQILQKAADMADARMAARKAVLTAGPIAPSDTEQDVADFKNQLNVIVSQKQLSVKGYQSIMAAVMRRVPASVLYDDISQAEAVHVISHAVAQYMETQYAKIDRDNAKDLAAIFVEPMTDAKE